MTIKMEPIHAGEFLLSEGAGNISRESINVAASEALNADNCWDWSRRPVSSPPMTRPLRTAARSRRRFCSLRFQSLTSFVAVAPSYAWPRSRQPC